MSDPAEIRGNYHQYLDRMLYLTSSKQLEETHPNSLMKIRWPSNQKAAAVRQATLISLKSPISNVSLPFLRIRRAMEGMRPERCPVDMV